jgi:hypothetical protein
MTAAEIQTVVAEVSDVITAVAEPVSGRR